MKKVLLIPVILAIGFILVISKNNKNLNFKKDTSIIELDSPPKKRPPHGQGYSLNIKDSNYCIINNRLFENFSTKFKIEQIEYFLEGNKLIQSKEIKIISDSFKIWVNEFYSQKSNFYNNYNDSVTMEEDLEETDNINFIGVETKFLITKFPILPGILIQAIKVQARYNLMKDNERTSINTSLDSIYNSILISIQNREGEVRIMNTIDYFGYLVAVKFKNPELLAKLDNTLLALKTYKNPEYNTLAASWMKFARYNAYLAKELSSDELFKAAIFFNEFLIEQNTSYSIYRSSPNKSLLGLIDLYRFAAQNNYILKRKGILYYNDFFKEYNNFKYSDVTALALCNRSASYHTLSRFWPINSDSSINYIHLSVSDLKTCEAYKHNSNTEGFRFGQIANIFDYYQNYIQAYNWSYLSFRNYSKVDYNTLRNTNQEEMFYNMPLFLFKAGYIKEAEALYWHLSSKSIDNLYQSYKQLANRSYENMDYTQSIYFYKMLLDTAKKHNNLYQQSISIKAIVSIYEQTNDSINFWKYYKQKKEIDSKFNLDEERYHLVPISDVAKLDVIASQLSDSTSYYSDLNEKNKVKICILNCEINKKQDELVLMNRNLTNKKEEVAKLNDTIIATKTEFHLLGKSLNEQIEKKRKELIKLENKYGQTLDLNKKIGIEKRKAENQSKLALTGLFVALLFLGLFNYQRNKAEKEAAINKYLSSMTYLDKHFISNLTSELNLYVRNNNPTLARQLLNEFGELNRTMLKPIKALNSTLSDEIKLANIFLGIHTKLMKNFTFEVIYPENWEQIKDIGFPYGLMQLFCENSVKHGLYYRSEDFFKKIEIKITLQKEILNVSILDNGIGRKESAIKQEKINRESYGTQLANSKIEGYNKFKKVNFAFKYLEDIYDENENCLGTNLLITALKYEKEDKSANS